MRAIKHAEENGFAMTVGEWIAEANSAAAVIRSPHGYPKYALNIGGLQSIVTKRRLVAELGPRVFAVARQIEERASAVL